MWGSQWHPPKQHCTISGPEAHRVLSYLWYYLVAVGIWSGTLQMEGLKVSLLTCLFLMTLETSCMLDYSLGGTSNNPRIIWKFTARLSELKVTFSGEAPAIVLGMVYLSSPKLMLKFDHQCGGVGRGGLVGRYLGHEWGTHQEWAWCCSWSSEWVIAHMRLDWFPRNGFIWVFIKSGCPSGLVSLHMYPLPLTPSPPSFHTSWKSLLEAEWMTMPWFLYSLQNHGPNLFSF